MAQDVISTLFGITPRNAAFDQYLQERMIDVNKAGSQYADLGRANIERASAMMQNAGTGLGIGIGRLLGGMTPQMAEEQRVQGLLGGASFQDPEQLMMASERFAQAGDIPRAKALQDAALDMEKTKADIARLNSLASGTGRGAGGTGAERMIQHIVKVEEDEAAGKQVSVADKNKARYYRMQLSQVKTYKMPDDTIITISVKDFTGQQDVEAAGGVPFDVQEMLPVSGATPSTSPPTTPTAPTTGQKTPGVRVTETPASQAAAAKKAEAARQEQVVFESDINQIDNALDIVESKGRLAAGAGSLLSFLPESSAGELADIIQSIDAAKLIQQIQALKSTSATGATGFGSLTEQEGQRLINRLGSINQRKSPEKLKEALLDIRTLLGKLSGKELPPRGGASVQTQYSAADTAQIERALSDPRNKGKTRQQIEAGLRKRGKIQ